MRDLLLLGCGSSRDCFTIFYNVSDGHNFNYKLTLDNHTPQYITDNASGNNYTIDNNSRNDNTIPLARRHGPIQLKSVSTMMTITALLHSRGRPGM